MTTETKENLAAEPLAPIKPHNLEIERAVLGALLYNNNIWEQVSDTLVHEDCFFDTLHARTFTLIKKILESGKAVDALLLENYAKGDEAFAQVSNLKNYFAAMVNESATPSMAHSYAHMLLDLYKLRALEDIGKDISHHCASWDGQGDVSELINEAENQIFSLTDQSHDIESQTIGSVSQGFIRNLEQAVKTGVRRQGIATSLLQFDEFLGGFQKSDLIVLAARPGMGKTALACTIASNVASRMMREQKPPCVLFFSLEMSREQIAARILSLNSKKAPVSKLMKGDINADLLATIKPYHDNLRKMPLIIDDTPALSLPLLRLRARRLKRQRGDIALILVDYLQLMRASQDAKRQGRVAEVSEISQGLKAIAKELNVPVVALSQLSREIEKRDNKWPLLSDLRDSGTIEQDADIVMFVHRDMEDEDKEAQDMPPPEVEKVNLIIGKNRNGATGKVKVGFNKRYTHFGNWQGE